MTELTFLVDLLLNHKLPKATREAVAVRIKEVEGEMVASAAELPPAPRSFLTARPVASATIGAVPAHMQGQSASTIAAMQKHELGGALIAPAPPPAQIAESAIQSNPITPAPPAQPVAVIAQTPAAQAAMQARNETILAAAGAGAFTGKPEKGRTSPRKF